MIHVIIKSELLHYLEDDQMIYSMCMEGRGFIEPSDSVQLSDSHCEPLMMSMNTKKGKVYGLLCCCDLNR